MKFLQNLAFQLSLRLELVLNHFLIYFNGPPKVSTLKEWENVNPLTAYDSHWSTYRDFFIRQGYTLWKRAGVTVEYATAPPNDIPRAPDGFSHEDAYSAVHKHGFSIANSKLHAARTKDNRDVVILLLSDGTSGNNALEALQVVGTGATASTDRNHVLPMLQTIHHDNLVFGVFPLVGLSSISPWFGCLADGLEFVSQIMEGVAFMHERRVVHRDLFLTNFLSSRRSGCWDPDKRSDFLCPRYYIIDFEWAIYFPSSDATVVGPPTDWSNYNRPSPPEMRSAEPHCPFKADAWQLGWSFRLLLENAQGIPDILDLFESMCSDDPDMRPTARVALDRFKDLRIGISSTVLRQAFEEPYWLCMVEDEFEEELPPLPQ